MHQSHALWLGQHKEWGGREARNQGHMENTVMPDVALWNTGFQKMAIVLLNVFAQ
jgi:hypothetical protein